MDTQESWYQPVDQGMPSNAVWQDESISKSVNSAWANVFGAVW